MADEKKATFDAGLIGLGNMGQGLGKNILENGFSLVVQDLKPSAVSRLEERGAVGAIDLKSLMSQTDIVMTCLPSMSSIEAVYESPDGIIANVRPGMVIVDFSTSSPELTRRYGAMLEGKGAQLIDTPMLRNPQAAFDGTLQLLVSGPNDAIERAKPLLEAVSEELIPSGDLGNGHAIKLINNAVTIANGAILCETFTVARKMGIDLNTLNRVMGVSFAASKKLPDTARRLIEDDHKNTFSIDVSLKDIDLFTKLSLELGALTPIAEATRDLFRMASQFGYGDDHNSRVGSVLARFVGTDFGETESKKASS